MLPNCLQNSLFLLSCVCVLRASECAACPPARGPVHARLNKLAGHATPERRFFYLPGRHTTCAFCISYFILHHYTAIMPLWHSAFGGQARQGAKLLGAF